MTTPPDTAQLNLLLPQVVDLASQAGAAILQVYAHLNPAVEYKRDNSPVTQADLASHHIILNALARIAPAWPVLSEESAEIPFAERSSWRTFWLVDPLDGTKDFLRRNGEFTVNIALIHDSRPILGVVCAPAIERLYYAASAAGAWRADSGSASPIRTCAPAPDCTRIVISRSHAARGEDLSRFCGPGRQERLVMGSSLKFCLVAEGSADVYPRTGPTMEWDTAAAQCVLEQAGGVVTDHDGHPLRYNKPSLLNPGFVARATYPPPGS